MFLDFDIYITRKARDPARVVDNVSYFVYTITKGQQKLIDDSTDFDVTSCVFEKNKNFWNGAPPTLISGNLFFYMFTCFSSRTCSVLCFSLVFLSGSPV